MAIQTNTNPRQMDLQPEMRNMLMRNGLQAHIAIDGSGYRLIVQGHDSPLLVYPISERQMLALTDWGTNTANKKAYNVLTSIVGKDFYMPKNFVHARNANGRVATALASASTVAWDGWECPRRSSAGRHATSGASTCAGSAANCSFRGRPSYPNVPTGA